MTLPVRTLILTAAVAASLAACQRREDKADAPPAPAAATTPAAAGAAMAFWCDASENASWSSRLTCHCVATFSAVRPMP